MSFSLFGVFIFVSMLCHHPTLVVLSQPAGPAAAPVPTPQGAGLRRQAREHAAHVPALLPVQGHAPLPRRHEERGKGVTHSLSYLLTYLLDTRNCFYSFSGHSANVDDS